MDNKKCSKRQACLLVPPLLYPFLCRLSTPTLQKQKPKSSVRFRLFSIGSVNKDRTQGVPPIKQVFPAEMQKEYGRLVRTLFPYSREAISLPCVEKRRILHCVLSVFWITIILPSRFNHIIQEKFPHEFIIVIHSQDLGMFTYFFKN